MTEDVLGWLATMDEDERYCGNCDAAKLPMFPWQGAGHVASRSWVSWLRQPDAIRDLPNWQTTRRATVILDGSELSLACEAMMGDDRHDGWVIEGMRGENGRIVVCPICNVGMLMRLRHGDVRLTFAPDDD